MAKEKEMHPGDKANQYRENFISDLRRSSILTREFVSQIEQSMLYVQGLGFCAGVEARIKLKKGERYRR